MCLATGHWDFAVVGYAVSLWPQFTEASLCDRGQALSLSLLHPHLQSDGRDWRIHKAPASEAEDQETRDEKSLRLQVLRFLSGPKEELRKTLQQAPQAGRGDFIPSDTAIHVWQCIHSYGQSQWEKKGLKPGPHNVFIVSSQTKLVFYRFKPRQISKLEDRIGENGNLYF